MPEGRDGEQAPDAALAAPGAVHSQSGTHTVFISYASSDRTVADSVCAALERAGVTCWIAPRDVTPGEFYSEAIVHAIDSTKVVVLVLSQNAAVSQHVLREVERASSKRHPVVSFRIDLAPIPAALEYFLNTSQWLDASATGVERALPKLVDAVQRGVAHASDPTSGDSGTARPPTLNEPDAAVTTPARRRSRLTLAALAAITAFALAYLVVDQFWLSKRVDEQEPSGAATPTSPSIPSAPAIPDKSIAVLPFADMSAEKNQEYMSDGIAEELLNLLAQVPDLKVIARTSSFAFKGQNVDIADIAKKLNVAHVLEGSVRTSGNKLRITAQLVRASDSSHIWSQTYDRQMTEVFEVQDQIAAAVVSELKLKLLDSAPKAKTTDPRTYALFLQGREIGRQYTEASLEQSNRLFQQVLTLDPTYVAAWEGLANNYSNQAFSYFMPVDEAMRLARDATNKAVALGPTRAMTHIQLGFIASYYDLNLQAGAKHLEAALALEPSNPDVLLESSTLMRRLGRLDAAIAIGEYQVSLDPVNPLGYENLANAYRYAGRVGDAISAWRTIVSLSPNYMVGHEAIGELLLESGDAKSALKEMQQEASPGARLIGLSMAYDALGQMVEADAALDEAIQKYSELYPFMIAYAFAYRGEADRAFEWLDKAAKYHDLYFIAVAGHPYLSKIHSDRRWLPFLRKHGFAPEQLAAIKFDVALPQ